jgi:catechol 2,3-dioxygenase-like lactoylglutathione lyase family enzyme
MNNIELRLEVVALPVSDVDRALAFYSRMGWRLDVDLALNDRFRVVQMTPPGSACSVAFGTGVTSAAPGSFQNLHLVVPDIVDVRQDLAERGVAVSKVFHGPGSAYRREARVQGPDPNRTSYQSYASFEDPDGNGWILQEITTRLPGR